MSDASTTRRGFFERVAGGLHGAALVSLLGEDLYGASGPPAAETPGGRPVPSLAPRPPHFEPRAKAVIHLFMNGGPSQMDLFDPKPTLDRHHGKAYYDKIAGDVENPQDAGALMRSPFKFAQHGESGMWVSDAMPHLAGQVDDLALDPLDVHHEPDARAGRST